MPIPKTTIPPGAFSKLSKVDQKTLLGLINNVNQAATVSDIHGVVSNIPKTETNYPSLTTQNNQLSGDVSLTPTNTFYDGPTLTLPAGTWEVKGAVQCTGTQVSSVTAQLWDGGSNVYASGQWTCGGNGYAGVIPLCSNQVVGPVTVTISAACNLTGANMRAAATVNGVGNNASYLNATRIG